MRQTTVDTTKTRKKKIVCCWRISMSDEEERPEAEAARSSSLPRCSLVRCCSFLAARGRSKRARFAVGEGPTKDEVYWRNLRPEVRKISSLFYIGERNAHNIHPPVYVHPRFVSLLARAMRDFLTIEQPRRLFARLTMRRATSSRQNDRKLLSSRVEDSLGRRATRREARVGIGKLRTDVRRHWRSVRRIFIRVGRDEVHARGERILVEKERRIRFLSKETGAESIRGEPKCVLADERFGGFDICCHKWYNR